MAVNYHYSIFKLKFLFVLFLFSCEFNTEKIPNIGLKKNGNSIIPFLSSSDISKNNEKAHQKQNTHTTNLLNTSEVSIDNVQYLKKDDEKDEKKETLKQEENSNSDNPPKLNQPCYPENEQKEQKERMTENFNKQQLPDQNSKSTKDNSDDSSKFESSVITKQIALSKKSELHKPISEENLISITFNPKMESTLKPDSQQQSLKLDPELKKISINNQGSQESFKEYKIQDTRSSSANDAMMYEVSLGIKDGSITNNSADYSFNKKWKLFLAKFNNEAVFIITDNYIWGHSFRVGDNNYVKDGPKGIGLHFEQSHLSKFKNAMTNTYEVFEAQTYDYMENDIKVKVHKRDGSDYIFFKFEVTTDFAENRSSGNNEEEFDSFDIIKDFLSEKSFAVKKSDFNSFIKIIG